MQSHEKKHIKLESSNLQMVDVVSLYPTSYLAADNMFPCGDAEWTDVEVPDKLGFYRIVVKQREDLPNVLPFRSGD